MDILRSLMVLLVYAKSERDYNNHRLSMRELLHVGKDGSGGVRRVTDRVMTTE